MRPSSADTSEPACVKRKMFVDEEQHVLVLLVAKILGDGEAGETTRRRAPGGSVIWP